MLIQLWRPGDRIFLFGFSRGAYTVRCLAGVLAHCGIPTRLESGTPMKYDEATARRLAKIAVKKIYQHAASVPRGRAAPRENELMDQRLVLTRRSARPTDRGRMTGPTIRILSASSTRSPRSQAAALSWFSRLQLRSSP